MLRKIKICLSHDKLSTNVETYIKKANIIFFFVQFLLDPVPVLKVGDHGFGEEEEVLEVLGGVLQRVVVPELSLEESINLLR